MHQVIPMLLEACPSFLTPWEELCLESDEFLPYVAWSSYARHLLTLQQSGDTREFAAVAQAIERLHVEGAPEVREAATIGLLEGIQIVWGNSHVDTELFAAHLLPQSAKWWRSVNDFWNGECRFVGDGL